MNMLFSIDMMIDIIILCDLDMLWDIEMLCDIDTSDTLERL